jgi:hypothetical protein
LYRDVDCANELEKGGNGMHDLAVDEFFDREKSPWPEAREIAQLIHIGFFVMWLFVGLVSAYDAWLVVKYWDSITQLERNPICTYFIDLGNGKSELFLRVKTGGTLTVLSVLAGLYRNNRRLALPVAGAVSAFQFGLLVYLNLR